MPPFRLRLPVVAGATILLHYLALGWVGGRIGMPQQDVELAEPVAIVAQLRAPPPAAQAPASPAPPKKKPAPRRRAAAMPAIAAVPPPEAEAPPEPEVPAPPEAIAEAPPVAEAVVEEPPAESPAAPLPRQYRASVPPSSELALELERVDSKGTLWHGEAGMSWQVSGGSYKVKFDAGISMLVTKVNLLALASEGAVSDAGFDPQLATEKRRGKSLTATHFNRGQGSITFSAVPDAAPLPPGAQDKATLPLQLAAIARADPAQFEGGMDITVGEERAAAVYHFSVAGQEEIQTKLGRLHTWRLVRPPKPGSYNSRLEVWLAPERGWVSGPHPQHGSQRRGHHADSHEHRSQGIGNRK
ncbi:DUF3108 domain-containing protein [Massilia cavernae]|uniref:DUF3108 domain-containing protein n=1 Tax=Massilia cavernae TaxID=2320864 RepID=UPI001E3F030F|nr:DUF3108 domain-containing protein [Massilia cavernae]